MTTFTTNTGVGGILPETYAQLILEPALAKSVATQPQVSTVIRTGSHATQIPVLTDDVTSVWLAEGAEITPSDATFNKITVTPSKCAALTLISSELADDSNPQAAQLVGDSIARDLAKSMDAAYFGALAAPAPSGLGALTGVSTVDAGSAWANLDAFIEASSIAETHGAEVTAYVANPATALALAKVREGSTSNRPLLGVDPSAPTTRVINGVPLIVSPNVADGVVWAMPKDRVMTVVRTQGDVKISEDFAFSKDMLAIRGIMRIGFGFPAPSSIVKISTSAPAPSA